MSNKTVSDRLRQSFWCVAILAGLVGSVLVYQEYLTPRKLAVRQRLAHTDRQAAEAIHTRLEPLSELFANARKGAKGFASEVLSLNGKWQFVKGAFVKGNHQRYLEEAFTRHVFSAEDLRSAMESSVHAYLDDLEGYEAEMLVKLRADLAGFNRDALPSQLADNAIFRREYQKMSGLVAHQLNIEIGVYTGNFVGSMMIANIPAQIAGQAARAAAIEMGMGSGLIGGGGVSLIATLGVAIIAMKIIDDIIEEILKFLGVDPAADIEKLVLQSIDKLEKALLRSSGPFGWGEDGSLRKQLKEIHETRSKLRREAIHRLLKEGGMQ